MGSNLDTNRRGSAMFPRRRLIWCRRTPCQTRRGGGGKGRLREFARTQRGFDFSRCSRFYLVTTSWGLPYPPDPIPLQIIETMAFCSDIRGCHSNLHRPRADALPDSSAVPLPLLIRTADSLARQKKSSLRRIKRSHHHLRCQPLAAK